LKRTEFEELLELSRKTLTEKPKSELIILALIFFNGGRMGINEIRSKIETQYNSGWFTVTVEELEEIIPYLITKRLLNVEGSYYVIPTNLLAVIKDIIEENLFPEKDEVEKILKELSQKLKTKMKEIVSSLVDGKFYYYKDEEMEELSDIEKYGLLIFCRAFFSSVDKISFGDNCVYIHPTVVFAMRSDMVKDEFLKIVEIHKDEVYMLKREKRELMERIVMQQDRINLLYDENEKLREKIRNLEEFQKGTRSGLFSKNMILFRIAGMLKQKSKETFIEKWNDCQKHDEIVHYLCEIFHVLGFEVKRTSEDPAEPDIIATSFHSDPSYVLLIEVKTVTGNRKLSVRDVSQVISKKSRYEKMFRGFKVSPVIVTNISIDKISDEAIRECKNNAIILTTNFIGKLLESHFEYKHTPSLLYAIFELKDNPIPTAEIIKLLDALSREENERLKEEVIKID